MNKANKIKKGILVICCCLNIVLVLVYIYFFIIPFFTGNPFKYTSDNMILNIRMILIYPAVILWINNLIIWSRNDKNIKQFFLIIFLNIIYNSIYFMKILKNNWQFQTKNTT